MGITRRQRKLKKHRNGVNKIISSAGLKGMWLFGHHHENVLGVSKKPFRNRSTSYYRLMYHSTLKDIKSVINDIEMGRRKIYYFDDQMYFKNLDELRKHLLIKKLSGIGY